MSVIFNQKANASWIIGQAMELKALLSHNSENMVKANKNRALADVDSIKTAIAEIEEYVKSL